MGVTGDTSESHPFDLALSSGGIDCRPFRRAVSIETIRTLLGVERVWFDGFRGQNIVVGIIDEGVNGEFYPVTGGFTRTDTPRPGGASIESHGSMCAADILVAAPSVKLYDYPFIGVPKSGGALAMFQEVLNQRRLDGTPHLTSNSYGFYGRPPQTTNPTHEVWDINHPIHRKVQEVIASGCPVFFAAGNCGAECASTKCHQSGIGPGNSIHASSSLKDVITVAAVNSQHQRIGYSSQGPGGFESNKPDIAAYSHFFGNFGPGRPAGGDETRFDNGTSAATPVAAGVGALLMSAISGLTPERLKAALIRGAFNIGPTGWDPDTGWGVINAAASYQKLRAGEV
jgi:subtilisin family serine protease